MRRTMRSGLPLLLALLFLSACGLSSSHGSVASGEKYAASGQYRAAYIEAKKVLQRDDSNGMAWLLLGEASLHLGNPNDALKELKSAQSHGVAEDQWAVPMAQTLLILHEYDTLIKTVAPQAAKSKPDQVVILALRGDAFLGLNQLDDAGQAYQAALALDPKSAAALVGLAKLAAARHDSNSANQYIQQALAFAPNDAHVWIAKGDLDFAAQDIAGAEADYEKAVSLKSPELMPQEQFYAISRLANCQIEQNKLPQAAANIQTLEKMSPEQPYPHYLHAVVDYKQGNLNEAVSQLQQVLKVLPNSEPAQLLLGAVNYAQGNLGQAQMYSSNVLGMDAKNAAARKLLAITLYRQGQSRQALDVLRPLVSGKTTDATLLALLQKETTQGPVAAGQENPAGIQAPSPIDTEFLPADKALRSGNPVEAVRLLKSMPHGDAGFEARRNSLLVVAYLSEKRLDEALRTAADYVQREPNSSAAHLLYGVVLIKDNQQQAAYDQYLDAYRLDPKNIAALMSLGDLDTRNNRYPKAAERYQAVLKLSPNNPVALMGLGRLAALQGDNAEAIKQFKQAIQANPKMTVPYEELILVYSRNRQFTEALNTAQSLIAVVPNNAAAINTLGATQLDAGHYKEAQASLERAVKIAPAVPLYRTNLARAQILNHNFKDAEQNLTRVITAGNPPIATVALLAFLKLQDGHLDAAVSLARGLQKLPGTRVAGLSLEGDLYMTKAEYAKAAHAYHDALKLDYQRPLVIKSFDALASAGSPDAASVLQTWLKKHADDDASRMLLGEYYLTRAQYPQSADQYEQVLKKYPSNLLALNNLAWVYTEQHDAKALPYAERAYKLAPDDAGVQDTYAWALVNAGKADVALPILAKAAGKAPAVPAIRYHLAVAQARTGDTAGAKATLHTLLNSKNVFDERTNALKLYRELGGSDAPGARS